MKLVKADKEGIKDAAMRIRMGGVVVYPTDTVYGLGCDPGNLKATRRVCKIKERATNPLPLICATLEDARRVVEFNRAAEVLADRFWPGPLTLVLPKKVDYSIWVNHGKKTLGIRVPNNETARELAQLSRGIIVSTSANKSGQESQQTIKGVIDQIGDEVDIIIDAGPTPGKASSTVLDLTADELWILRSGPVTGQQIVEALKG